MNTTENVKTLYTLRLIPPLTTRKTTHHNPTKRKMLKTTTEEYLPMELQPSPQTESTQQYAIPLISSGRVGSSDDSMKEMRQICNKLDEYTKDLENIHGKRNGEMAAESLQMGRQFFSFVSTCDSATRELDTTINVEHKILESLYEGYQKEAELLEQLGEEDITTDSDIPACHDKVSALISKLMEILLKLEGIKHSFKNHAETHPLEHPLVSPPIKTEKKGRKAQIHEPDLKSRWDDHSQYTESVLRELQELMANTDNRSKEVLEKIIHDIGQLFDAQAIELQKLAKEQEETENKYVKVKTNYQALLQEKGILEIELKKLLDWKAGQKSSSLENPSLEDRLETDVEPTPSTLTSSVITPELKREAIFSCGSEEVEKVTKLSKSQDKAELQEEAAHLADFPVSTLHKKAKIQKEGDTDFSEISFTYDLDPGTSKDPDVVELEENGRPESKTVLFLLNQEDVTEENDKKAKMKSLKSRGRRPSTVSSKTKLAKEAGKKSSKTTFISSQKSESKLFAENTSQPNPEMFSNASNQRKAVAKISRTLSSSGKDKAKFNEEVIIATTKPSVQSHRDKEAAPQDQQMRVGSDSLKSAGKQQGRRQSISYKSRRLSLAKEEKLDYDKQKHMDPNGKRQIMKVFPENQHEEQKADKKLLAVSVLEPSVVNIEEKRDCFTEHSLSSTPGHDQESFPKDVLEHDRQDKHVRSGTEETAVPTQYSGVMHSTEIGQVQEDTLPPYHISQKSFLSTSSALIQGDPSSISDEALDTQDACDMDSCKIQQAEKDISPPYDDTKKILLSFMSQFTQTDPSNTFEETFNTKGKMDFPDFKEQSLVQQLSIDDESHHAQLKDPQWSLPSTAVVIAYPPSHHNIQIPYPEGTNDTCSRFLSLEKNLASKMTETDGTSQHLEYLEIPDEADKEMAQSGNQLEPAMMTQDPHEQNFTENVDFMEPGLQTVKMKPEADEGDDLQDINALQYGRPARQSLFGFCGKLWIYRDRCTTKSRLATLAVQFGARQYISSTTKEKILTPLLGQSVRPQEILMFHPPMIPSQGHKAREVQANEFPLYDDTFSRSFGTELYIQGRHMSITRSLSTEKNSSRIPSPTHPRHIAGIRHRNPTQPFKRLFDTKTQLFSFLPLDEAKRRTQQIYGKRVSRTIPREYSILPTLTANSIGRGVTPTSNLSGKWASVEVHEIQCDQKFCV
ncbi:uncharacterized protein CCDC7 [Rhinoderma darwinii]|uniref:uncharacterized protein CCDC7 n=1 Tax=Rhinoderma darwinii TaxID=43563 RepID=UPI003F67B3F3